MHLKTRRLRRNQLLDELFFLFLSFLLFNESSLFPFIFCDYVTAIIEDSVRFCEVHSNLWLIAASCLGKLDCF